MGESSFGQNIKIIKRKNHSIKKISTSTIKINFGVLNMTNILYILSLYKSLIFMVPL